MGVWSCIKGRWGEFIEAKIPENCVLWSFLFYINNLVLWRVFALLCMTFYTFLCFFLTVIYLYKELSFLIRFSQLFVSSHIKNKPCHYFLSHTFHKNSHLSFGLIAAGLYDQSRIKLYLVLQKYNKKTYTKISCLSDWTICGFDSDRKSCLYPITWSCLSPITWSTELMSYNGTYLLFRRLQYMLIQYRVSNWTIFWLHNDRKSFLSSFLPVTSS